MTLSPAAQVRAALIEHGGCSPSEERSRRQTLRYLDWLRDPLDEFADPTHVTASAIVLADDRSGRVVLHLHKRLQIWLQPGGHVDAGETVHEAAVREVFEETGLVAAHPVGGPLLVHIDVHQGPRGHVHLDTRWLLFADARLPFAPAEGESTSVSWFTSQEAIRRSDRGIVEAIGTALDAQA